MNTIDIIDWGKLENTIEENLPDNNTQAITAEKVRDTLYEFEDKTITLDNNIASVNDAVNALDETCARKKYVGRYSGITPLANNFNLNCQGFYYTVEEATVVDDELQPQNGLYVRCDFIMAGTVSLTNESGTFFKNVSVISLLFSDIRDKALELSGFDKNDYVTEYSITNSDNYSYNNNKLIFMVFQRGVLNCFSTESIANARINTSVTTEFYLIKQNND